MAPTPTTTGPAGGGARRPVGRPAWAKRLRRREPLAGSGVNVGDAVARFGRYLRAARRSEKTAKRHTNAAPSLGAFLRECGTLEDVALIRREHVETFTAGLPGR